MTHEPECPANWGVGEMQKPCSICPIIRKAYERGRKDAEEAIQQVHFPADLGEMYGLDSLKGTLVCDECESIFYEGGGEGTRPSLWPCSTIRAAREDGVR